jgi:hypothetical protein
MNTMSNENQQHAGDADASPLMQAGDTPALQEGKAANAGERAALNRQLMSPTLAGGDETGARWGHGRDVSGDNLQQQDGSGYPARLRRQISPTSAGGDETGARWGHGRDGSGSNAQQQQHSSNQLQRLERQRAQQQQQQICL